MAYTINTNIASLQAQQYLRITNDFEHKTINRVTSGLRIVSSGDDAAGLAIANAFRSDRAVLMQGIRNGNDGLSTLQTIDGGLNNISQLLDRARTLAAQSASGTFTGDRAVVNNEFQSVLAEIDRQATAIGLNTGGDFATALTVFIGGGRGTNPIANGTITVDLSSSTVDTTSLGINTLTVDTAANAQTAVTTLATAVTTLGAAQAVVGQGQNRVTFAINLAQTQLTNITAAESRIRDADLAAEAANLTKAQIMAQAGIAALAQANLSQQAVLSLLRA